MLSKHSNDIAIHSSCYSAETQDSLKYAKGVWSIIETTEVLSSIIKIDYKVNFLKGRTNKSRKWYVFLGATPRMCINAVSFNISNGTSLA